MKRTMLIVDDTEMNREILNLLFHESFDTVEAEDGKSALEVLHACQGNIDIILLDLIMPGMDGHQVLKKIKSIDEYKNIPIIVITASSNVDDQIKAFENGANDFVTKPFVPEIVFSRVKNVVESVKRYSLLQEEKELMQIKAELDEMTGIYNKSTAERIISDKLQQGSNSLHALLLIDIDNFKSVNDNEGHLVGDHTIKIIANQIISQFRSSDVLARVGGDEFAVLMTNIPSKEMARKRATELAALLKYKPNLTIPANVSVSVGLSFSNEEAIDYKSLFKMADKALYEAKHLGKARMCEFGQTYLPLEQDDRAAILLFSSNRNVCSTVHAVYDISHIVFEIRSFEEITTISENIKRKVTLSYLDIADETDFGINFFKQLKCMAKWIFDVPCISICEEGNLEQFKLAMENGTTDILTVPIEIEALKRRSRRYLKTEESKILAKEVNLNSKINEQTEF